MARIAAILVVRLRWMVTDRGMSRRFFLGSVLAGAAALGAFWWLTTPPILSAVTAAAHTPDLANGMTTFNAGGGSSCHAVPFPFNVRRNIGIWKLLFMDGKPFVPDAARSASWNRGAYLVGSLGHCAECHSPRNFLGGIIAAQRFAGGPNPEGEGWVPNITQKGLGKWSENDIAYFLETGETPDNDTAGGSMARVIKNTSQLSPDDRAAIAEYLKSLPPVDGPPRPKKAAKGGDKS